MSDTKSSISGATSYQETGDYWDRHDLVDIWEETQAVTMTVNIQSSSRYIAVEPKLGEALHQLAKQRGISAETLINLWLQERLKQESTA